MREEIKTLLRRFEKFLRNARYDYENGDYDLAMFHIEQAIQLMVKAKLLDLKSFYERTYELRRLILELSEIYSGEELKKFVEANEVVLRNLERAYVTSRYLYEEFFKEEVEEAFKAAECLRKLLWKG